LQAIPWFPAPIIACKQAPTIPEIRPRQLKLRSPGGASGTSQRARAHQRSAAKYPLPDVTLNVRAVDRHRVAYLVNQQSAGIEIRGIRRTSLAVCVIHDNRQVIGANIELGIA